MAYRNPEDRKRYFREYLRERYQRRKREAAERLGGACARCGSFDDLEVDHIDRAEKTMPFSRMYVVSRKRFEEELSKCQLLCRECHQKKSIEEAGLNSRDTHGTYVCYRYSKCRCEACRATSAAMGRAYRARKRAERMGL